MNRVRAFVGRRESLQQMAILVVLVLLWIFFSIRSPYFLTTINMANIGREIAAISIVAFGMTFVMICGEIDLSVGSLFSLCGVILALLMRRGVHPGLAVLVTLGVGLFFGTLNGVIVVKGKVSSLLITLGMLSLISGLAIAVSAGETIPVMNKVFVYLTARGSLLFVPLPVLYALLALLIAHFVLSKTKFGWDIYATGGGLLQARLAGVPTDRTRMAVMTISGGVAAIGGILLAGRLSAGLPSSGVGMELNAIAAVILGGTSFSGGRGSVLLTLLGALVLATITNGLTLLEVGYSYQLMFKGAIIIAAVLLDKVLH